MAHVWKTVCKSGFFPAMVCMHWGEKTDAIRFGRECLYLLSSLGTLHSLSLTEVRIHPLTMVLNKIFFGCLFIYFVSYLYICQ